MAVTEVISSLTNGLPDVCWLSFKKEDVELLLSAVLVNPTTSHLLPSLVDKLNDYSMPLYGPYVAACKKLDDDDRETNDGAVVSVGDNGAWVQTWTWVTEDCLNNGEEEDSESATGAVESAAAS